MPVVSGHYRRYDPLALSGYSRLPAFPLWLGGCDSGNRYVGLDKSPPHAAALEVLHMKDDTSKLSTLFPNQ